MTTCSAALKLAGSEAVLAEEPRCDVPSMAGVYGPEAQVNAGNGVEGKMTNGPDPVIAKVMTGAELVAQFVLAKVIASRSVPPLPSSRMLVTTVDAAASDSAGGSAQASAATRGDKRKTARTERGVRMQPPRYCGATLGLFFGKA